MESGSGSQELTRLVTAWLTSLAFGVAFLVASATGADGMTALIRGAISAGVTLVAASLLAPPVVDVVLSALARDEAKRQAEKPKEDDA